MIPSAEADADDEVLGVVGSGLGVPVSGACAQAVSIKCFHLSSAGPQLGVPESADIGVVFRVDGRGAVDVGTLESHGSEAVAALPPYPHIIPCCQGVWRGGVKGPLRQKSKPRRGG